MNAQFVVVKVMCIFYFTSSFCSALHRFRTHSSVSAFVVSTRGVCTCLVDVLASRRPIALVLATTSFFCISATFMAFLRGVKRCRDHGVESAPSGYLSAALQSGNEIDPVVCN